MSSPVSLFKISKTKRFMLLSPLADNVHGSKSARLRVVPHAYVERSRVPRLFKISKTKSERTDEKYEQRILLFLEERLGFVRG